MSNNLIKGSGGFNQEEVNMLREKFLDEYSRKKGWDKDKLSPSQMLEIVNQQEYKNPGLLLG